MYTYTHIFVERERGADKEGERERQPHQLGSKRASAHQAGKPTSDSCKESATNPQSGVGNRIFQ